MVWSALNVSPEFPTMIISPPIPAWLPHLKYKKSGASSGTSISVYAPADPGVPEVVTALLGLYEVPSLSAENNSG